MQSDVDVSDQIQRILGDLVGFEPWNAFRSPLPIFNLNKPNQHDSKKEFMREKRAVEGAIKNLTALLKSLLPEGHTNAVLCIPQRTRLLIDSEALNSDKRKAMETAGDLLHHNMASIGMVSCLYHAGLEAFTALMKREVELKDQEREFWSLSHRAPNYFARTIALRIARFYGAELHKRPTFGLASDGGHPSTGYGKAVEQIFEILEIKSDIRGPIEWALGQLTDSDIRPQSHGLYNFVAGSDRRDDSEIDIKNG